MRKLASSNFYSLFLSPSGFELFASPAHPSVKRWRGVVQEPGLSLLGPFQVTALGAHHKPLSVTKEAALYTVSDGENGEIELRFPAADGSGLLFVLHIRLDDGGLLFWQTLRNQTHQTVSVQAFQFVATPGPNDFLDGAGTQPGWRVFRSGYSSFTPSFAVDSRFRPQKPLFPTAAAFNLWTQSIYYGRPEVLSSPWMMVFTPPGKHSPHLLVGYVSAKRGLGEVALCRDGSTRMEGRLGFEGRTLPVGDSLVGDKLFVTFLYDERAVLDAYADRTSSEMSPRKNLPEVPSGWCSWYYYYTRVTEGDVLRNLAALRDKKVPVKYVQLDDGYQRKVGDWLTPNAKFPNGLGAVARQIKEAGFVPGIWLAPFFVQRSSEIYKHHRDWLLRDEDGVLRCLGYHPFWGLTDGQVYGLDLTHPEVLSWLRRVFRALCDVGFDYFKIDFLFAGLRQGQPHDSALSPVEAYRQGLRVIRETIGDRFLLGCGAPLVPTVGFVDAMRISPDVKEAWRDETVDLIAHGTGYPSTELALQTCLTRAYLHNKWWCNDPDCVLVRREKSSLSLPETQTLLTVMSLSGGMLFVGDDVRALPKERLDLLQKALPPTGNTATVVGVLDQEKPQRLVFEKADAEGGQTRLVAVVNWADGAREMAAFSPELLCESAFPSASGAYIAFEFWSQTLLRVSSLEKVSSRIAPHGAALWLVLDAHTHPQVATATHHLWQTLVLLAHETWEPQLCQLTMTFAKTSDRDGEIWIAVPDGYRFDSATCMQGNAKLRGERLVSNGVLLVCGFEASGGPTVITVQFERQNTVSARTPQA